MLKEKFMGVAEYFCDDIFLMKKLWSEIFMCHNSAKRAYHNLSHLAYIFNELNEVVLTKEEKIILYFSTFYHDIIYDVKSKTNEAQSAILGKKRLLELGVDATMIKQIIALILLTKTHDKTNIKAYQLFLDVDLAILGEDSEKYKLYLSQIREEYGEYSDIEYKRGRIKVLKYFLEKKQIFQSDYFYKKYEKTAQKNIHHELLLLK